MSQYGEVNDLMDKIIKFGAMRFEENSPAWGRKQGPSGHPHQLLGEEKELLEEIEKDADAIVQAGLLLRRIQGSTLTQEED